MADRSATSEQFGAAGADRPRQLLDLGAYAVGVVVALFVVLGVVSALLGSGLVGVKYGLFLVGTLMFGYGSLKLRPVRSDKSSREARFRADSGEETRFQAAVQRLLPARYRLEYDDRLTDATKLFVTSLVVLAVSFLMEAAFGVAVS